MLLRALKPQFVCSFVFAGNVCENIEGLAAFADQLGGMLRSEGSATRQYHDWLQDTGFSGSVWAIQQVKPRMRLKINTLQVSEVVYLDFGYLQ